MKALVVAACSLTLSLGAAVGLNLQKLSMNQEEKKAFNQRPPYCQPLWCTGFIIQVLDACGDFVFIGLAPQTLLAPLGALSLGFNVILAPMFHQHEVVTRTILAATGLIYAGTILTVLHAPNTSPTYTLAILVGFIFTTRFIIYALACISFQVALMIHGREKGYGIVHYCGLAGCFGGECILFAKSTSELVKNAIVNKSAEDWTSSPIPYLFVFGMLATVLTNVNFLNQGLAKFDALLVIPVYQSFWNAFGITGGLIFFQEDRLMSLQYGLMYALGIAITLAGVALLVKERAAGEHGKASVEEGNFSPLHSPGDLVGTTKAEDEATTSIELLQQHYRHSNGLFA